VPSNAIDGNSSSQWASANGQTSNQFLTVELARGKSYPIDRIRILSPNNTEAIRDFRIDVSNTTSDDSAFTSVMTSTALNTTALQEFVFPGGPIDARYIRLYAFNNYGHTCCVAVSEFQVVPVPTTLTSFSSHYDASYRPEMILDNNAGSYWSTANGQVTDQFVEVQAHAGHRN
jgi:hypothetical protein